MAGAAPSTPTRHRRPTLAILALATLAIAGAVSGGARAAGIPSDFGPAVPMEPPPAGDPGSRSPDPPGQGAALTVAEGGATRLALLDRAA